MPEQSTEPRTIGAQLPEIQAVAWLATMLPDLPPASIDISPYQSVSVKVALDCVAHFETWRDRLQVSAGAVTLHAYKTTSWLSMTTVIGGQDIEVVAHLELDLAVAVVSPQADAERRARTAESAPRARAGEAASAAVADTVVMTLAEHPGGATHA